jgi:hypothetical protein
MSGLKNKNHLNYPFRLSVSVWVKLYCSGSDSAMITQTCLDYPSFHYLCIKLEEVYSMYTPYSSNGKLKLKRQWAWIHCPQSLKSHGCSNAPVLSLFRMFGFLLLLKVLRSGPGAKVQMPSLDELEHFKQYVLFYNFLDVFCVICVLKLLLDHLVAAFRNILIMVGSMTIICPMSLCCTQWCNYCLFSQWPCLHACMIVNVLSWCLCKVRGNEYYKRCIFSCPI